jgi:hypothetical protein
MLARLRPQPCWNLTWWVAPAKRWSLSLPRCRRAFNTILSCRSRPHKTLVDTDGFGDQRCGPLNRPRPLRESGALGSRRPSRDCRSRRRQNHSAAAKAPRPRETHRSNEVPPNRSRRLHRRRSSASLSRWRFRYPRAPKPRSAHCPIVMAGRIRSIARSVPTNSSATGGVRPRRLLLEPKT